MEYTIEQAKEKIKEFYLVNQELEKSGDDTRFSLCLVGDSGIGKTSGIRQAAKELGVHAEIIRLSQYEDIAQLSGKPITTITVIKDGTEVDINERFIKLFIDRGYVPVPNSEVMVYSTPKFLSNLSEGDILVFDDFRRQLGHFSNATMEIINEGRFLNWSLPKGVLVVLSSNEDDGDNDVVSLDTAQEDRMETIKVRFDKNTWMKYAEKTGIDNVFINFIYKTPEIVEPVNGNDKMIKKSNNSTIRKWTKLFRFLKARFTSDYSNIAAVRNIGYIFVKDDIDVLISFISSGLDKIVSPERLLDDTISNDEAISLIEESIKLDGGKSSGPISSLISFRLINYIFSRNDSINVNQTFVSRILSIITSKYFEKDNKSYFTLELAKDDKYREIYEKYVEILKS